VYRAVVTLWASSHELGEGEVLVAPWAVVMRVVATA
jgi:hypothetical protein